MKPEEISRHIIAADASLLEAMGRINALSGDAMTLMVVDADGTMRGTLTDGDVRRAILSGISLSTNVSAAMHKAFRALRLSDVRPEVFRQLRRDGIRLMPVLDADGRIADLIDLNTTRSILPLSALIMAGGKGERLRPLTLETPKPLLELEGKAIIDYNIEMLASYGIRDVYVSVRYLAEKIERHFASELAGIHPRCIREDSPLGTIGVLSLIDDTLHPDVLVMNSDILTDLPLDEMYQAYIDDHADITVAAIPYNLSVPYAILSTNDRRVTAIEEKPTYSYYANAGIYIIGSRARALLSEGRRTDAPDLIEAAIADGLKVTYFPINGTWIDIGTPTDFRHAAEMVRYKGNL